jgi:hypothetical protein
MAGDLQRFDRTLRVVMWTDAFLSAAVAVLAAAVSPVVAAIGLPSGVLAAFAGAALGCAGLLAGCGAMTAVLLVLRVRAGVYVLPAGLRLPLPAVMRPPVDGGSGSESGAGARRGRPWS